MANDSEPEPRDERLEPGVGGQVRGPEQPEQQAVAELDEHDLVVLEDDLPTETVDVERPGRARSADTDGDQVQVLVHPPSMAAPPSPPLPACRCIRPGERGTDGAVGSGSWPSVDGHRKQLQGENTMPVAGQRDPAQVKVVLEQWLAAKLPDATDVEITDLVVPQSSGFSNETFLLDARWIEADGTPTDSRMVLRSQPALHHLFPEIDLIGQQYTVMRQLGLHSDVPVPVTRWAEPDPAVLGGPFFVMDRLDGLVPGDSPPYTQEGFVFDMDPATRAEWHRNAIEALTKVSKVDWKAAGLEHLDKTQHGPLGPEQRKSYFAVYKDFATKGEPHPIVDPAWDWLWPTGPTTASTSSCAGATPAPGTRCSTAPRSSASSTGRWCRSATANRISVGGSSCRPTSPTASAPSCCPACSTAIRPSPCGRSCKGRPATHVDFYERLGGFQFCLVMCKLAEMYTMEHGAEAVGPMATHNPVSLRTAELIGIDVPPPPTPVVR